MMSPDGVRPARTALASICRGIGQYCPCRVSMIFFASPGGSNPAASFIRKTLWWNSVCSPTHFSNGIFAFADATICRSIVGVIPQSIPANCRCESALFIAASSPRPFASRARAVKKS